jgi:hypothetical protein
MVKKNSYNLLLCHKYLSRARTHTKKESIELKIWILCSRNILELSKS